jgi:hypothetical protein
MNPEPDKKRPAKHGPQEPPSEKEAAEILKQPPKDRRGVIIGPSTPAAPDIVIEP